MNKQQSIVSTIKKGFFLGLGAVIPFVALEVAAVKYAFYETESYATEMIDNFNSGISSIGSDYNINTNNQDNTGDSETTSATGTTSTTEDSFLSYNRSYTQHIRLSPHQTTMQNGRLLVTGQLTNEAKLAINSIEIEAELFKDGTFVYECSDYISMILKPGQSENYMIKCGCNKGDTPEFDEVTVKISRASRY